MRNREFPDDEREAFFGLIKMFIGSFVGIRRRIRCARPARHVRPGDRIASPSANANVFAYNNNGTDAELGTSTGGFAFGDGVPINFNFSAGAGTLPADLTGFQNAMLSMTASTISFDV